MVRRKYWGLATLIILLIGVVSVFIFFNDTGIETDINTKDGDSDVVVYKDKEPEDPDKPPAEEGYVWLRENDEWVKVPAHEVEYMSVWDGDHYDKVPVRRKKYQVFHTESELFHPPEVTEDTAVEKTKYATEAEGYTQEGVEGVYITRKPRDPARFGHLPAPPLPPSAVPEDCPEHLRLPPELVDGVYREFEPDPPGEIYPFTEEVARKLADIIQEIIRDYNPNRPLTEIWDQFIEYEKMYRAYAEWELGYTPEGSFAGNRTDWGYEQLWAFPEIIAAKFSSLEEQSHGEEWRFEKAVDIAMGYLNQDWNKITLKDGRDFFIKGRTRYEFVYSGVTEEGDEWRNTTGFARTRLRADTPVVRIDVLNTSDAELKALMGWDYTINPVTMQPLQYDGYYEPIRARSNKYGMKEITE